MESYIWISLICDILFCKNKSKTKLKTEKKIKNLSKKIVVFKKKLEKKNLKVKLRKLLVFPGRKKSINLK